MKKILFLFKFRDCSLLYNIFSKYKNIMHEGNSFDIAYPYFDGIEFLKNVNPEYSIYYKNFLIDIRIYEEEVGLGEYENMTEYDDKIIFSTKYDFEKSDINESDIKKIFIVIDEIPQPINNLKFLIANGIKFISSGNLELVEHKNAYFYDYKLAILFYYYRLGFYHINLNEIEVKKQNILGFYHKSNYKTERDDIIKKIYNTFEIKNNKYITNYSLTYNDYTSILDLKYDNGWFKNHITSYTDYIKSICILVFETDIIVSDRYHMTEKTLKAILFSKLNIPCILVCSYKQLIELVNDGYWFLNCEFIDFNLLINSNHKKVKKIIEKSIDDSVNFLLETFESNSYDLQKTNELIKNKFSDKMQNNYKIFNETISDIKIQDDVMNFILEPPKQKII